MDTHSTLSPKVRRLHMHPPRLTLLLGVLAPLLLPLTAALPGGGLTILPHNAPSLGSKVSMQCSLPTDHDLAVQYVSWSRRYGNGSTSYVYEYDVCSGSSKAFNELAGRASLSVQGPGESARDMFGLVLRNGASKRLPRDLSGVDEAVSSSTLVESGTASDTANTAADTAANGEKDISSTIRSGYNDKKISGSKRVLAKPNDNDLDINELVGKKERELASKHIVEVMQDNDDDAREKRGIGDIVRVLSEHGGTIASMRNAAKQGIIRQPAAPASSALWTATLTVSLVRATDEGQYECRVKVRERPPLTATTTLTITVPPGRPSMDAVSGSLSEGDKMTLTCRGNLGRPAAGARVVWARQRIGEANFWTIPSDQTMMDVTPLPNGTSAAVAMVTVTLAAADDGAIYRCEAHGGGGAGAPWSEPPADHVILDVSYPPRDGKILYDSATDKYYCHVKAKPAPSYVWLWIQEDGTKTIMSADQYLDLSSIKEGGYFRFRCLGSNVIQGVRHTSLMDTRLKVDSKNDQTKSGTQKANADEPIRYPQTGDGWSGWGKDKTAAAGAGPVWDVVQAGYGGGGQDDTQTVSTAGLSSGTMRGTIAGAIGKNRLTSVLARLPGAGGGSQADGGVRDVLWGLDEYNNPRPPTPQPTTTTTTTPRPTTTTSTTPAPTTTRLSTLANNFGDPLDFFVNEFDRIEESVRTQQQEETNGNDVMRNAGRSLQNLNSKFNSLFNINIPPTQNTVLDQRSQLFNNRPTAKSLPINDPNAIINLDPSSKEFMIMREFYKKKKHQYDKSQEELLSLGRPSVPPERALSNFQGSFQVEKILSNRNNGNNLLNSGLMQPSTQANNGMLQPNSNNILKNVLLQSQQQQQQTNSNLLDNNGMLTNQQNLFNLQSISQSFKRKNPVVSNPFSGLLPKSQAGLSGGGGLGEDQVHQQLPLFTPNQQLNSPSQHLPQTLPEHSLSNLAQTFNYGQQPNGLASLPQPNIGQHNMGQPNMGQQPNFKPGLNGNFQPPPSQNMGPAQDTENRLLTLLSHPHQLSMSSKAELDHMLRTATLPQLVEVQRLIQAQEQQRQGGARQGADIQNTVNNVINSRMNSVRRNPQMFYKEGPSPSPNNQIQLKGNYDAIQTGGEMYHQQRSPQIHPMSGGPAEMPFNHQPAAPQAPPPPPVPDFSPYSRELNSYDDAYYDNSQYDNEYELAKITTHQEYDCRRKNDGVYGGGCRAFYRCEAGDTYRVECKGDYVQNRRTGHCDTAKNSPPPCGEWKDCSGRGNGKYADVDAQCLTYYTCHEGVFLGHNECNPGTVFDEKEQVCNWPDSVLPPCGRGGKRKTRRLLVKRKRKVE